MTHKQQHSVDHTVEQTLKRIRVLEWRFQAIMAGQGNHFDEDATVAEMQQQAESIGITLKDAYEYAEAYRHRLEAASE